MDKLNKLFDRLSPAAKRDSSMPARCRMPDLRVPDVPLHMPLYRAYLCQDCNFVGNQAGQCPACASRVLQSLQRIVDRVQPIGGEIAARSSCLAPALV